MTEIILQQIGEGSTRSIKGDAVPRIGEYVHFHDGAECYQVKEIYYDVNDDGTFKARLYVELLAPVR